MSVLNKLSKRLTRRECMSAIKYQDLNLIDSRYSIPTFEEYEDFISWVQDKYNDTAQELSLLRISSMLIL